MKNVRFYLEFETKKDKRNNNDTGNVLALYYDQYWVRDNSILMDCVSCVQAHIPNSGVCHSSASQDYVTENCKRISEERARIIHPVLFIYLDSD